MSSSNTTDAKATPAVPTIDEIETSGTFITKDSWTGYSVKRVHEVFAVKYGECTALLGEADTLRYLHDRGVLVPRLHAVLTRKETAKKPEKNYLVMDYIDGDSYLKTSTELNTGERHTVEQQFKQLMLTLRSLPSEGYYGMVYRRPFRSTILNYPRDEPQITHSPFFSET